MNASRAALVLSLVVAALIAAAFLWLPGMGQQFAPSASPGQDASPPAVLPATPAPPHEAPASQTALAQNLEKRLVSLDETMRAVQSRLDALETSFKSSQKSATGIGTDRTRLASLEASIKSLQHAVSGVSLEKASAERQALFAAQEGYLKADEYAAAGQHAIAGEGYLTFLQHNPDHADARDVMKKARDSFLKAGYNDKAFWVHEEMMKTFPENRGSDLWEQARLEKDAGLYDRAVTHAAAAAEIAPNPEERLWRRLYWAWYVQLRDGAPAGIAALQQVQQEIAVSGVKNPKLTEHAAKRMQEWGQQANRR